MNLFKISIIMINYNRTEYIKEAIQSVLDQSLKDWELVIVDDGSTDSSENIIKSFSEKDDRIVYFKNEENLGIVYSRNKTLKNSKADLVAVLDSDDIWVDNFKLEKQVGKFKENKNLVLVGGGVIEIDKNGKEKKRYLNPNSDEKIRKNILFKNPFAHSSVMFKKSIVEGVGGYNNLEIGEDYDLWLRLGKEGKFLNLDDYLVKYRVHSKNTCNTKIIQALKNNIILVLKYRKFYGRFYIAITRRLFRYIVGLVLFKTKR
ncbi:MAG: glycosyltransferase [Candidatus Magasanikbacteria bacterium]|nr:glycosyltransferase [Candidatus Magasanikbacteria bacterium]